MSFFSKAPQVYSSASNFFKKSVAAPTSNFFRKNGPAVQILDATSVGLRKAGNTLGQISNQAGRVIDSPAAAALANLAGPQGMVALQALRGGNQAVGLSGNLVKQGAAISNRGNYSGSPSNVATNILERSKQIYDTGAQGRNIQFV